MRNYFGIAVLLTLFACSNQSNKSNETKDTTAVKNTSTPASSVSFKDGKVQSLYDAYISLKDALVASKFDNAKVQAKTLTANLKAYIGCENTAIISDKIENAADIAEQRKQFTALSTDVIALFKHAELTAGTIFIQHCPMANKGDGGDWMASEKKIQNPYYGSEMMECGSIVEEIKAK